MFIYLEHDYLLFCGLDIILNHNIVSFGLKYIYLNKKIYVILKFLEPFVCQIN